jgi:hypothetical protein
VLTLPQLGDYIAERHARDLFRLEALPHYNAASDADDYRRYLRGETHPDAATKQAWLDKLRTDTAAGRRWRRVHAVWHPLSDYLRYECEWGYTYNVAHGEDVRILDLDQAGLPRALPAQVGDFFVIDGEHAVRSYYDDHGRFSHAHVLEEPGPYLALAELLWHTAEPFTAWWAAHPQYHRGPRAA